MALALAKAPLAARGVRTARPARRTVTVRAGLETSFVVGASTVALLSLGRFVFLPYQRREADYESKIGPKTTGTSYFDNLQKPSSFTLQTNDPAGFNIIDVFAWGALGHAVAFAILGAASGGLDKLGA